MKRQVWGLHNISVQHIHPTPIGDIIIHHILLLRTLATLLQLQPKQRYQYITNKLSGRAKTDSSA